MMNNTVNITRYLFSDLILDVRRGELFQNEEKIHLPKLSYDLLKALVEASGALLSQQELMEIVWSDRVIGDETLKQRVKLLRKAIGDSASEPRYIEAVRGRGYRLIPEVKPECIVHKPASVIVDLSGHDHFPNIADIKFSKYWHRVSKIGLMAFFLLLIMSGFNGYFSSKALDPNRIIILPFKNDLAAKNQYLASGIYDYLNHKTSKLTGKQVISPSMVKDYASDNLEMKLIAEQFNAGLIIEGEIYQNKDTLTVKIRLNDSQQQALLWSHEYLITADNLYEIQNTMMNALAVNIMGTREFAMTQPDKGRELAYELYLKGRNYYKRYRKIDNAIAIDFFNKAIIEDPELSLAFSGLSQAYSQQLYQFNGNEQDKNKAIDNAYKAIARDNTSAESYKALGAAYYVSGWLSKSIDAHLKAYELAKNNIETVSNLGFIYNEQGKIKHALNWHKKALTLDPEHVVSMVHLGQTLENLGQYNLARTWYSKAIELQPDYILATYHLGSLEVSQANYTQAEKIFKQALSLYQDNALLLQGMANCYFYAGNINTANKMYANLLKIDSKQSDLNVKTMQLISTDSIEKEELNQLESNLKLLLNQGSDKALHSYNLALVNAYNSRSELAIRYLVQAIEQGLSSIYKIESQPLFSEYANDPVFSKVILNIKEKQYATNKDVKKQLHFFNMKS